MPKSRTRRPKRPNRPRPSHAPPRSSRSDQAPEPTRYTPKAGPRIRPRWHNIAGIVVAVAGLALIVLNLAENEEVGILPGGHSPLYLLGGLLIVFSSIWWFGAFDRRD